MKPFLNEDFLLETKTAQFLYHTFAKNQPIIDYHNHLSPEDVSSNKKFENITQVWLYGDHYKWRAMRANGIDEEFITGKSTSDWQKFEKWAETVPYTLRNPLYHWTHLELQRYFGISKLLSPKTAREIFEEASDKLINSDFSTQHLLKKQKVEVICTTDDPVDSLNFHLEFKGNVGLKMLPTFRPDKAMQIENSVNWNTYLNQLEKVVNNEIQTIHQFWDAIKNRHDYFASAGCRLSDHGLETMYATAYSDQEIAQIFNKLRKNEPISEFEILKFKSACLYYFAVLDAEKGWTQQFHIGAIRNNSNRLQLRLGADCGADSIGDFEVARSMSTFFNRLDVEGKLAKTIIYNLNPSFNEVYATMIGNFQDGSVAGKIQFGSGWWFLDQKDGMEKQINALSNMGLLSRFVGMLTDSRSFLSFPRHEYFRRILCNILGNEVEKGEIPYDESLLGEMIEGICYKNAKNYFGF
jgi:glucuronate isomerase